MNSILFISFITSLSLIFSNVKINNTVTSASIFYDHSSSEVKDYYSSLSNGLKGDALLSALQPILKNNQKSLSKSAVGSSWKYFVLLDRDWEKDPLTDTELSTGNWKLTDVTCRPLYEENFQFISTASPGNSVNREHIFPKSHGFQDSSSYAPLAGTDLQNLHMGEAANNQQGHSDYPYGNVADKATATKIKSVISGNITGYTGLNSNGITVYEPMDRDKGDIARSLFYMAARYHTYDSTATNSPALKLVDSPKEITSSVYAFETQNNPCEYGILSDLLNWNVIDPVDNHEIHRNNLVYNACQYNRNPFIDYPSWADIAFNTSSSGIDKSVEPKVINESSGPVLIKEGTPKATYDESTKTLYNLVANNKYYLVLNDGTKLKVTANKDDGCIVLSDYLSSLIDKTIVGIIKIGDYSSTIDSDTQTLNITLMEEPVLTKEITPTGVYKEETKSITSLIPNSKYFLVFNDSTNLEVISDNDGIINLNIYLSGVLNKTIIGLIKIGDNLKTINSDPQTFDIIVKEEPVLTKEITPTGIYNQTTKYISNLIPNSKYSLVFNDSTNLEVTSDADGIINLNNYLTDVLNKAITGLIKIGDNLKTINSDPQALNILIKEEIEKTKENTPTATYDKYNASFVNLAPYAKYNLVLNDGSFITVTSTSSGIISLKGYLTSLDGKTITGLIKVGDDVSTIDSDLESFNIPYSDIDNTSSSLSFMDQYGYIIYISIGVVVLGIISLIVFLILKHKETK